MMARHVVGRIAVTVVADTAAGNPASRAANRIRRLLSHGAQVLPPTERALFTGFVLGDDRAEPPDMVLRFRASGLSHLTAVSGENVAFVLVAAGPLLRRLGLRGRWMATVGLVLWFALLTRFEPSVLRAASMAGLTATSTFLARPASTVRLLALSVTVCTLLDPLLVHAAGWWLSVGATAGIALLGRPLAARLPGPRTLAESLAVTASAQVGVAPASLALFGGMPVVSVLANLLAVPAAAPVMVWGLPAGLVAGLVPRPVASALHLPSLICIRWIVLVANVGSRLRLGTLSLVPMLLATLAVTVAVMARRHLPRALALAALVLVLVGAAVHAPSPQAASPAWPAGGRSPVQPAGSRTAADWSRSAAVALGPGVESLGRVVRDALHPP
jgi:competence protein ComEC